MLELRVLNRQPGLRKNGSYRSRGGAEIWLLPCHLYVTYCPPGEGLCCSSDWIVSPPVPSQPGAEVFRSPVCPDREGNRDSEPYVIHPRSHSLSEEQPGSQPRPGGPQWLPLAARKSSSWKNRFGVGAFSWSSSGSPEANLLSSALLLLTHLPGKSQVSPLPWPLPQLQVQVHLCLAPHHSLVNPRWL